MKLELIMPGVVDLLVTNNVKFELIDFYCINTWFLVNDFKCTKHGRIDWNNYHGHVERLNFNSFDELFVFFNGNVSRFKLQGTIVVSWSNVLRKSISLDLTEVHGNLGEFCDEDFDMWITSSEGWCIEIYHENEICIGLPTGYLRKLKKKA